MRSMLLVACVLSACRGGSQQSGGQTSQGTPPESEAPVALNPDMPIAYPPAQFDQKVEGDVTLRLFVDSTGKLIPESTRVAEASGYAALDSAALAGSAALRFAPAKRHGVAVATAFLQPVEFRQVGTTRTGTATPPQTPTATPPPAAAPPPARPRPRPPVVRDTTGADTTRILAPAPAPAPVPVPVPVPARPDTTPPDTTKARTDTSATAH